MGIKPNDLEIAEASLGEGLLLTDVNPAYDYKNGERQDNIWGHWYTVAAPKHALEKLRVKIEGKQLIDDAKVDSFPQVRFSNLVIKMYYSEGTIKLTASASDIKLVGQSTANNTDK